MTNYKLVQGTQTEIPKEIDTDSSPNVVYQRKNIVRISALGTEGEENYIPEHWEYEERTMTVTEYEQYRIAMEQADAINSHSDQEAIDDYTRQLMDEGVI